MIYICGHFAIGTKQFDGQTVKTRNVYDWLVKKYGAENVKIIDTHNWRRRFINILFGCTKAARTGSDVIIMPSRNGLKVFSSIFAKLKRIHKFQLHYVTIGGWLYDVVREDYKLKKRLKRIDHIYVESHSLANKLKEIGVRNVCFMPNFKCLKKGANTRKTSSRNGPFQICTFSRVEEDKGILDIIGIVNKYNKNHDDKISLNIYGEIKNTFKDKFYEAISGNTYVKYMKAVSPNSSVKAIEKNDLLVFPTKYKTEGIPGTIIDAYFAGVPVLASKWENFNEIIVDGETGVGYEFGNTEDCYKKLENLVRDRKKLLALGKNCLAKADEYSPEYATKSLMENIDKKIDFVVLWVDNKDKAWQSAKKKYAKATGANNDVSEIRYRDWDLLKYWFRGVEQFAPWVNKIHFVTCGHLPKWLDTNNPKLHIVKHSDYMPKDALPTFNSNAIEISAHKIDGLAEQFVLFNDDFYLLKAVKPEDFFKNGKPVNTMALHPILQISPIGMGGIANNNLRIINKHFNFRNAVRKNLGKYLSLKQRKFITKTYPLLVYKYFPGFATFHMPNSYLKSTWEEVWEKEGDVLNDTLHHRFRDYKNDNNHWLFNFWQFASGNFCQRSAKFGIDTNVANPDLPNIIAKRKAKCVNAGDADVEDFEKTREEIAAAFEKILPNKSEFEK